MEFDPFNIETFAYRCQECGGRVCICSDRGKWAAHCMYCDNTIGHRGYYDPCVPNKYDACKKWNNLNKSMGKMRRTT